MKWFALPIIALLEVSDFAESAAPDKADKPVGPLVEMTPNDGVVFTAVLLNMKDGVLEIQSLSREIRQETK